MEVRIETFDDIEIVRIRHVGPYTYSEVGPPLRATPKRLISTVEVRSAVSGPGSLACQVGQPHAVGLAEGRKGVRRQRMVADGVRVARQPFVEEGLQLVFGRQAAH